MKKFIFPMLISLLSLNCYAEAWYGDTPDCRTVPGNTLTVCYQNSTPGSIAQLSLREDDHFENGRELFSLNNLGPTHPNNFSSISTSQEELKSRKIEKIVFTIVEGGSSSSTPIPGCEVDMTPASSSGTKTFAIQRTGDGHFRCS